MRSVAALITELQRDGITLFSDGNEIRFKGRAGAPSSALMQVLSLRREEVAQYLRARDSITISPIGRGGGEPVPSPIQEMWWNWIDRDTSLTLSLIEFVRHENIDSVIEALREIVAKHEALRASFCETDGILAVTLNSASSFDVEVESLASSISRNALASRIDEFTGRQLRAAFQWLVRGKIFIVPGQGQVVAMVANHLVVDGASLDIIRGDLHRSLKGLAPAATGAERVRYTDFARWQKDCLTRSGDALSRYWQTWTDNQRQIHSPMGKVLLRWQPGRKVRRRFTIPPFAHAAAQDAARRYSTFPYLIYLTVFSLSIARWSGQPAFPLRCICDGRVRPELAGVVGLMTGADAISVDIDPGAGFCDVLKDIEREYYAAARLRLPTIYAFPPFATKPELRAGMQSHNVAIVMNYRKSTGAMSAAAQPSDDTGWPPVEDAPRHDHWRHAVSSICLELTQLDKVTTAAFLLHEDILSVREQDKLIQSFFAVFREMFLENLKEPQLADGKLSGRGSHGEA